MSFKGATYTLTIGGLAIPGYAAVYSVAVNLLVAVILSLVLGGRARQRAA